MSTEFLAAAIAMCNNVRRANRCVLLLGLVVFCAACKIEISVPEGGRVVSTSGTHTCETGETCVIDVVDEFFDETFEAQPAPGFTFTAWRRKASAFCGGLQSLCRLFTSTFPGTPLEPFLASDDRYFLEPVFARSNTWSTKSAMPTSRVLGGTCVMGGRIYVIGGQRVGAADPVNTVEMYDPVTDSWSTKASLPRPLLGFSTGVVKNKCYVFGGTEALSFGVSDKVYAYDPRKDEWSSRQSMPTARVNSAGAVAGGKVYVMGGGAALSFFAPALNVVEEYDPRTNSWRARAPMPTARWLMSATASDGNIYVLGGLNLPGGASEYSTVERYDPANNRWATVANLPIAGWGISSSATAGKLYAFGGIDGLNQGEVFNNVYEYDPALDSWQSKAALGEAKWGAMASSVDGQIYLIGGSTGRGPGHDSLTQNDQYTP